MLRHKPETIGLSLDENGWANVRDLLEKVNTSGTPLDFATLQIIVDTNDKKRFSFNEDKTQIRANQGHSIEVELNLTQQVPPAILYHGTAHKNLEAIQQNGLLKMSRQHVHLSTSEATAKQVGSRHGTPIVLTVNAGSMHEHQFVFYLSENGVWLTPHVPASFINW